MSTTEQLSPTVRKPATYADLEAVHPHLVAEILDGELVTHPRPVPKHSFAANALGSEVTDAFQRGRSGPGGWLFFVEPELHLGADVVVPDIAGWHRERAPNFGKSYIETAPDWVCEVLSPSTERHDKGAKRRIYAEAERLRGDTGEFLIGLLERRLDAVVYRAKFVPTVFAARQFVNHGHVKVNGQRVNIPSYRVKEGDVIEVRDKSKQLAVVLEAVQLPERDVPDYIDADHSKMTATFVRAPGLSDVPYPVVMEPNLVVEFYAKN